jgi:hypothetical protein
MDVEPEAVLLMAHAREDNMIKKHVIRDWPEIACMNCKDMLRQRWYDDQALPSTLGYLVRGHCPGCDEDYYVLFTTRFQFVAAYPIDEITLANPMLLWPRERSSINPQRAETEIDRWLNLDEMRAKQKNQWQARHKPLFDLPEEDS